MVVNTMLYSDQIENVEMSPVRSYENYSPKKGMIIRCPSKWSPKIESVCHVPRKNIEPVNKIENEHLVLVNEDVIKQERELLNENDDPLSENYFQRSILAEYPNLKIKDEFEFKACCVKLEKMDFSHVENAAISPVKVNPIQNNVVSTTRSRSRSRSRKRRGRKSMGRKTRSRETSEENNVRSRSRTPRLSKLEKAQVNRLEEKRRSSRLVQKSLDEETEQIQNQLIPDGKSPKSKKRVSDKISITSREKKRKNERRGRKRSHDETSDSYLTDDAISNDSDTSPSDLTESQKALFMEANGLTDNRIIKSALKSNAGNGLKSKVKRVSFARLNGLSPDKKETPENSPVENEESTSTKEEIEKDPAEEYRLAIAKYTNDVDSYKVQLNTWYECLCCDRKYHLIEQCKEHVRSHFAGMLTN